MLNLDELRGEPANVALLTKLDRVVTHFRMKLSIGNTAGLHLTDTSKGVVQRVNIEWHVSHEQSHHPARVIEVPVGDNDIADLFEWKSRTAQTPSQFETTAGIDQ